MCAHVYVLILVMHKQFYLLIGNSFPDLDCNISKVNNRIKIKKNEKKIN